MEDFSNKWNSRDQRDQDPEEIMLGLERPSRGVKESSLNGIKKFSTD